MHATVCAVAYLNCKFFLFVSIQLEGLPEGGTPKFIYALVS
ncbi:MAG: hypothetical protein JWQ28_1918 [Pedobacter sp.]|jgi:hypothetical protein|nr:hypothetical protein [Pedobacter sp.]